MMNACGVCALTCCSRLYFFSSSADGFSPIRLTLEPAWVTPSFMEMTVPDATLKLKQGLGRLIRTETDRGVVLILDGRITRKGYGRIMISSLPDCYIPEDAMLSNIGEKIERFLLCVIAIFQQFSTICKISLGFFCFLHCIRCTSSFLSLQSLLIILTSHSIQLITSFNTVIHMYR